jgi:surface antigen
MQTLRACTGGYEKIVRQVSSIPAWTQRALPSAGNPQARPHGRAWMHGDRPVKNSAGTIYLVVGCVRAGIPSQSVYQSTFGDLDFSRAVTVPDTDLNALPAGPLAAGHPLRRAGSLLESGGVVRWVTYHGGALGIPSEATIASYCRPWSDLVASSGEFAFHSEQWVLQATAASCLRGNDYPYAGSSMSGADPWNFYNRQCTSFSAWRLNQEGTEFHNYFRGPHWGDAHNWDNAARSAGVVVNGTARRGAIAQWEAGAYGASGAGHVAFVAAVHNDGTITIEEYNWSTYGGYGTRRISAAGVSNYIHFR